MNGGSTYLKCKKVYEILNRGHPKPAKHDIFHGRMDYYKDESIMNQQRFLEFGGDFVEWDKIYSLRPIKIWAYGMTRKLR